MHIEKRLKVAEKLNATSALLADSTKTDTEVAEAFDNASTALAAALVEVQIDVEADVMHEDNVGAVTQDAPA